MLKCKLDVFDEGQHFDSSGTYVHYGNFGYFGRNKKNHNSTVSTYIGKKKGEDIASYEQQVAMVLKSAAKQMSKYVAIVKQIIAPAIFSRI